MSTGAPAEAVSGVIRTRLMAAAATLLAESGDGRVSTRAICSAADVTAPTLYHHFENKDALLDAVVLQGFNAYLVDKRSVAPSGDVLEDFRAGWNMHVSFGCRNPGHYQLMFGNPQAGRVPPAAEASRAELHRIVTEWAAKGYLAVSVEAAAETMSAAAVGVTLQLIAARADSSHPVSINVRDTIAGVLFPAPLADGTLPTAYTRPAQQLLSAMPAGALHPLRATETALLKEWLRLLTGGYTRVVDQAEEFR